MDDALRRQVLISNLASNLGAIGRRTAPTSPAEALMQARMKEQKLNSMSLTD